MNKKPLNVDLVIPLYNEEDVLETFHQNLLKVIDALPHRFKIYYINDGSQDGTQTLLEQLAAGDPRLVAIALSKNFGHQAALTAGLDRSESEVVICLDGDGQHPPALIPQMIDLYYQGYDLVLTERIEDGKNTFKKASSSMFYWLINLLGDTRITPGAADFRLMSRQVVEALKQMPEYHRFLRGMVAWIGFKSVILPFIAPPRIGGKSKYSFRKMLKLATDAVFSFSLVPLQIGLAAGLFFFFLAFLEVVYVLSLWIGGNRESLAPGWSSLMFIILMVGGFLMVNLGMIGAYVGYVYQEVKRRPIYLIQAAHQVQKEAQERENVSPRATAVVNEDECSASTDSGIDEKGDH
jgi:glycosyltransferase involved in cell wall biosynthesis